MNKISFKWAFIALCIVALLVFDPGQVNALDQDSLYKTIEDIIEWKKHDEQISNQAVLLNEKFLQKAGQSAVDWYPLGMGRIGYQDDYPAYLAIVNDYVSKKYETKNKLDKNKATEWHRISLAILASGGDPTKLGARQNINLIADGTYNRGKTTPLGAQGLNGLIWGLITLDSMRYKVPADASMDREAIITEILKQQVADGGFTFNQKDADVDITAMAIQALAPYINSEKEYTYINKASKQEVTKTVRQVVNEALDNLTQLQQENGQFSSWGVENVESIAQIVVALTALGINPATDERFIKNGQSLVDILLSYKMDDGGFIHASTYNAENPTSLPDQSNSMASEQVLYALVSLYRLQGNYRSLYDFRPEMSAELKQKINQLNEQLSELNQNASAEFTQQLLIDYQEIPVEERSYVFNYSMLAKLVAKHHIKNDALLLPEQMAVNTSGEGSQLVITEEQPAASYTQITAEQAQVWELLVGKDTTEHYVTIVKAIDAIENSSNKESYKDLLASLNDERDRVNVLQKEIDALNEMILKNLYPFNELTLEDQSMVKQVMNKYNKLSAYDQKKILNYEDVEKSQIQIINLKRERILKYVVIVCAVILLSALLIKRRRKLQQSTSYK